MDGKEYNPHSVNATIARIEEKLDTALHALVDQNRRIVVLETAENRRMGALVAIGSICSVCGGAVVAVIEFFRK